MSVDRYLAEALASIIASIELTDDDEIDPDVATKIIEPVGAALRGMTSGERAEFSSLMRICAEMESNTNRSEIIRAIPEAFGLSDEASS